jgi:tyrosinase
MAVGSPSPRHPAVPIRFRRRVGELSPDQLALLRQAFAAVMELPDRDDRGYQFWAGIHGLPLPAYCQHGTPTFLPWHRAYLYFFEKALQDRVPGVTLPWWDWTEQHHIPDVYDRRRVHRRANPLHDSPIQRSGRRNPREARTWRRPGRDGSLSNPSELEAVLANRDFFTFQTQLENIHDGVHLWVGGTMGNISVAAYDPIFWAHHSMIDRCWRLWQLRHPGAGVPHNLLDRALAPFAMTVRQTLDVTRLGYDYAASTAATGGPGHHG